MEELSMEIQTIGGIQEPRHYQDLVCYFDIPALPDLRNGEKWMAAVYETAATDTLSDEIPLLLLRGNGLIEWQIALSCLDILLGTPPNRS